MRLLLILLMFIASTDETKADYYFKMAKVTCAEEIGLFEITSTGVANIKEYYEPGYDMKLVYKDIAKKHGLFVGGNTTHKCTIKDMEIEAHLNYREASPRGACGANPGAKLDVFINGEIVVDSMPFQEDCYQWSSYNLKIDQYNVWVCGGKGVPSHCVWESVKGKNRTKVPLTRSHLNKAVIGENGS